MGLVHFLHGNPKPPDLKKQKTVRCPNEKCARLLSEFMLLNKKQVCPHCKEIIPDELIKKMEEPESTEDTKENTSKKK